MKKKRAMSASRDDYSIKLTGVEVGDAKMYGARYREVTPYFSYSSTFVGTLANTPLSDMFIWCVDAFGPTDLPYKSTPAPSLRWYYYNNKFLFRRDDDLTLFLLKWQ